MESLLEGDRSVKNTSVRSIVEYFYLVGLVLPSIEVLLVLLGGYPWKVHVKRWNLLKRGSLQYDKINDD